MIFEKFCNETSDRTVKALIGITKQQFYQLRDSFADAYHDIQLERVKSGQIKRVQNGGNKGNLDSFDKKLFFILYYLKTYCTFDVLGFHFGFSSGHAHQHVDHLLPVLKRSLLKLNVLPERAIKTPEDLRKLVEIYGDIVVDGVECSCVRPQDDEAQKARYSGKKKDIQLNP
ncbi:MAG: transposase family protein [Methylococcaceae bacterium]|nr:transposase family protein [Methylococcaceae bacterium]